MRNTLLKAAFLTLLVCSLAQGRTFAQEEQPPKDKAAAENKSKNAESGTQKNTPLLVIEGTHQSATFTVSGRDLQSDQAVSISVSAGFSVSPSTIPANAKNTKVTVTLNSFKKVTAGQLVLRSGDVRSYVNLQGYGSSLPSKDLSQKPVYQGGKEAQFAKTLNGSDFSNSGYTLEFKVNTNDQNNEFAPFAVTDKGVGFKAYVNASGLGIYNAADKKGFSNPVTSVDGGLGKFYNNDGRSHVYRYAVTPDNVLFIYRDGLAIDTIRAIDYGLQPDFATETGDPVENLLKNPGFEGSFELRGKIARAIEGWSILIGDIYNSEQYIQRQEITNEQDCDNHVLQMKRYKWSDGWSSAEVSQVIDVAPDEPYTLSALVRGGIKEEGALLGKIKIEEVQDGSLGTSVEVSSDNWETYSMDYTTSAKCKQLRILFYLERDKRGATITPLEIDNVKLTGKSRTYTPRIGFNNKLANVEYFNYDLTGAYAPASNPEIAVNVKTKK